MTASKFVVRLMSEDDQLLSWAEVWASPVPQEGRHSCPFFPTPRQTPFLIEQAGVVTKYTVHWTDLDVVRSQALGPVSVAPLQIFTFDWSLQPVWLVQSWPGIVLPGVTVRAPVTMTPEAAGFGLKDARVA